MQPINLKFQRFVDYLVKKTKDNGICWRQSRFGTDQYEAVVKNKGGMAQIVLRVDPSKDQELTRILLDIKFMQAPHVAPVIFMYTNIDEQPLKNLDKLSKAVIEKTKPPMWLGDWIDATIEEQP